MDSERGRSGSAALQAQDISVTQATSGECEIKVRAAYPSLTAAQQKVADYAFGHPEKVIYSSVSQLAEDCGVSVGTVVRFCQTAGFQGYQEFKLILSRDIVSRTEDIHEDVTPDDDLASLAAKVSYANAQAINDSLKALDVGELQKAVDAIINARKVEFYGVGASGFAAAAAKYKFLRIGIQCDAYTDSHMQAMSAATLTAQDVAIGFSYSGSTKDVIHSLTLAKDAGATVICIVNFAHSPITQLADVRLLTASRETPLGSGALRSSMAQLHILDILFTAVAMRLDQQVLEFAQKTAKAVVDKLY
jgi:DNA-binding MurR/RpiR family transcriptional regulator